MSLHNKTKAELIEIIERDRDVVRRARQAITDLRTEQERRHKAEAEVAELRAQPELAKVPKDDIKLAKRWREMVEKQNGRN